MLEPTPAPRKCAKAKGLLILNAGIESMILSYHGKC